MNVTDLILSNQDYFSLPKQRPHDQYFPEYVREVLEIYKGLLKEIDEQSNFPSVNKLEPLADSVIDCVNKAYEGNLISAYNALASGISKIKDYLSFYQSDYNIRYLTLYRARPERNFLTKGEMFHVPFNKRHLLSDQRYSIQGLPCLYLCNSAYLCWEELGKPDLNMFQISRLEIDTNDIGIMDISLTADPIIRTHQIIKEKSIEDMMGGSLAILARHLIITWPIAFAVSIRVTDKEARFKPEYIVPQLLLQWVKHDTKFKGIKYIPTKKLSVKHDERFRFSNYVIPVIYISKEEHCSFLKQHIKITAPTSKTLFDIYGYDYSRDDAEILIRDDVNWKSPEQVLSNLELIEDHKWSYIDTIFGKFEMRLAEQIAESL